MGGTESPHPDPAVYTISGSRCGLESLRPVCMFGKCETLMRLRPGRRSSGSPLALSARGHRRCPSPHSHLQTSAVSHTKEGTIGESEGKQLPAELALPCEHQLRNPDLPRPPRDGTSRKGPRPCHAGARSVPTCTSPPRSRTSRERSKAAAKPTRLRSKPSQLCLTGKLAGAKTWE